MINLDTLVSRMPVVPTMAKALETDRKYIYIVCESNAGVIDEITHLMKQMPGIEQIRSNELRYKGKIIRCVTHDHEIYGLSRLETIGVCYGVSD